MNSDQYIQSAREAIIYFHNASIGYPNYKLSFDEFLLKINRDRPAAVTAFLVNYGKSLKLSELSTSEIKNVMENLAKQGQGRIPADYNVFYDALIRQVQNINWVEVVKDTAVDVAEGFQSFGENVNFTLKGLNAIFPFIVIGGLAYIAITKIRKVA